MAKLTISEASRQTGVARTTLYRDINSGRLSIDADRRIDTAELLRVGYALRSVAQQKKDVSIRHATSEYGVAQRPVDTRATLLQYERDALQRERDLLQREVDAARAREQAAAERERLHQEELAWLRRQFEQMQQRYDRLLEAPRPAPPPAPPAAPEVVRELLRRRPYAELPEVERPVPVPLQDPNRHARRQRILEVLAAYPEGLHWKEIGRLIGDTGDLNDTLQGMLRYKLVRRVGRGMYALPVIG